MYVHLSSPFLQAVSLHLFYLGRVPFFLVLAGYQTLRSRPRRGRSRKK